MKVREPALDGVPQVGKLKKKPKKRRFRGIKLLLTVLLLGSALVLLALSPFFNISAVKVSGGQHYNPEDIIQSANLPVGENGFKTLGKNIGSVKNVQKFVTLRCALAEDAVMNHRPYIKTAKVKYVLPGTFDINITERKPIGFVPYTGTNLIIDDEGFVLDTVNKPTAGTNPVIKGLEFENYELGQALKIKNTLGFETVLKTQQVLRDSEEQGNIKLSAPINSIDVSDLSRVCLLVDSRITVNFGDVYYLSYEELLYRINFFKQVFTKNLKKQDKGLLDFTMGDNPKFIPQ
ncbi:MAG: FtsQ-type POTRA domain-containing protein [Clostridia bacterium]|nr:FtsQ-type POTRA domain-containing protein [Clostridia bacterium]